MIIGFTGTKGSGKDTAAQFLIDTFEFQKVSFADPLKEAVCNLFDIPLTWLEKYKSDPDAMVSMTRQYSEPGFLDATEYASDMNLRTFLQRFGTEMGRHTFGMDFWVDLWEDYLYSNSIQGDNIVATDVRFKNEAEKIQHLGGMVVRMTRPGHEPDGHESEEPLPDILIDAEISNTGDIDDLHVDVHELYSNYARSQNVG